MLLLTAFQIMGQGIPSAHSADTLKHYADTLRQQLDTQFNDVLRREKNQFMLPKKTKIAKPDPDSISAALYKQYFPSKPFLVVKGGYINYNFTYRSELDTPFLEKDIVQHLTTVNANVVLAQKLPFTVSVYERRSNSQYLRDYTDVRIDFNASMFRSMQAQRLGSYLNGLAGQLEDPNIKSQMGSQQYKYASLSSLLNRPDMIKRFLLSKETLIHKDEIGGPKEHKDSVVAADSSFIAAYEKRQQELKEISSSYDSLSKKYNAISKKIQVLRQVFSRNINTSGGIQTIRQSLEDDGIHDKRFEKMAGSLYSIRTFTIGRTMPDYTNLTVRNISVTGINIEYNNNNLYAAAAAGIVDFGVRDFVQPAPSTGRQYVTAGRIGWGRKEGNHIIFTAYNGQRQIFSSYTQNNTASIFGLSLEAQWVLSKNIRLDGEIAQSSPPRSPAIFTDSLEKKFSLKDNNAKAYSVQLHSYFPRTQTSIDGLYEHAGINFQCFNAYKVNADADTWNLKAEQSLWSGLLHLTAAIRKNDFVNPLIQQNYSSNTVFKTFTATFHKRYLPTLSVGYIPSSQYSIINGQTYESRYQAFNVNSSYQYKIGNAAATTTAMFNQFYNQGADSGFVYYNARNIYVYQTIAFSAFSANLGVSHTQNPQYLLDVMEAGLSRNFKGVHLAGFGIKLNHLNTQENKLGYYIQGRIDLSKLGALNFWGESSYLPGIGNVLIKTEFINVGFTKYFK